MNPASAADRDEPKAEDGRSSSEADLQALSGETHHMARSEQPGDAPRKQPGRNSQMPTRQKAQCSQSFRGSCSWPVLRHAPAGTVEAIALHRDQPGTPTHRFKHAPVIQRAQQGYYTRESYSNDFRAFLQSLKKLIPNPKAFPKLPSTQALTHFLRALHASSDQVSICQILIRIGSRIDQ